PSPDPAPADQPAIQAAERPGPQRCRIRLPGRATTPAHRRMPRLPGGGEDRPRFRLTELAGQRPRPVPVTEVKAPEQRSVGGRPVRLGPDGGAVPGGW